MPFESNSAAFDEFLRPETELICLHAENEPPFKWKLLYRPVELDQPDAQQLLTEMTPKGTVYDSGIALEFQDHPESPKGWKVTIPLVTKSCRWLHQSAPNSIPPPFPFQSFQRLFHYFDHLLFSLKARARAQGKTITCVEFDVSHAFRDNRDNSLHPDINFYPIELMLNQVLAHNKLGGALASPPLTNANDQTTLCQTYVSFSVHCDVRQVPNSSLLRLYVLKFALGKSASNPFMKLQFGYSENTHPETLYIKDWRTTDKKEFLRFMLCALQMAQVCGCQLALVDPEKQGRWDVHGKSERLRRLKLGDILYVSTTGVIKVPNLNKLMEEADCTKV